MSNTNADTVAEFAGKDKLDVMSELIKTREALSELLQAHAALFDEERFHKAEWAARQLLRERDARHQINRGDTPRLAHG